MIALAATVAMVAILAIPHRGNPDAVTDMPVSGSPTLSWRFADKQSDADGQKVRITPVQAQVSVVGLAFAH